MARGEGAVAAGWRPPLNILISLLVTVMVALSLGLALWLFLAQQRSALEQAQSTRVEDLARLVAARHDVIEALEGGDAAVLQANIEALRRGLGVDFVVVMDARARRLTHPDPTQLGQPFEGGDEGRALAGDHYASRAVGTLGTSLRGFAPVRASDGRVLGAVAVGVTLESLLPTLEAHRRQILAGLLALLLAAGLGVAGLGRYLRRQLLGLEPWQIARLVEERQALLGAVQEGLLAVDDAGRITLANAAARRLLEDAGLGTPYPGTALADYLPPGPLRDGLLAATPMQDREVSLNGRVLIAGCVPIHHHGRGIGAVATLRDKGEVERLAEELTGVRRYAEALRAASHDFKNKRHVIAGLAAQGDLAALRRYLSELDQGMGQDATLDGSLEEPLLAGFLLGKLSEAREQGIDLRVSTEGAIPAFPDPAQAHALVTVLGNLLENAFEALAGAATRRVSLLLAVEGEVLSAEVQDTGPGIPTESLAQVVEAGVSTKGPGRGLGLALARERLAHLGGELRLYSTPGQGTLVELDLPLTPPRPARSPDE
ncbi:ATP-binding protein [Halomonas salifodinae]|uniref:ATP-binding protein n=1 Tax=Halomonas salifodinae TaxID=438745 RepID=UPI0033A9CFD4